MYKFDTLQTSTTYEHAKNIRPITELPLSFLAILIDEEPLVEVRDRNKASNQRADLTCRAVFIQ
jgi:hypothetical protein